MPTFDYKCAECHYQEEKIHGMKEEPEYKCPKCGFSMVRQFTPNIAGFIFKGGTETINWKEKRYRLKRSEQMAVKQEVHRAEMPKVQPNVAGVELDTWSDAQKVAKECGLQSETYTPFVEKENKPKIVVPGAGVSSSIIKP